jgi:hypothetical protein
MNTTYLITLDLVQDLENYDSKTPIINLTDPFFITTDSDPILIADYVIQQEIQATYKYNLEQDIQIVSNEEVLKRPVVIAKYCKFQL